VNLLNTLVFSTGCHAGYNLVDPDGIAGVTQTAEPAIQMCTKGQGAQVIRSIGDHVIDLAERVVESLISSGLNRTGLGCQALVKSKLAYLAATPEIGMHEKAL
jgi:hypothetical protein